MLYYLTRVTREIYPVWTEDTSKFFVDVDTVQPIQLFPYNTLDDESVLTTPLAVGVAIPIDTLHPLQPYASIFSISLFFIQVWIDGSTYCFAVQGRVPIYRAPAYIQYDHELKCEQTLHCVLDGETPPLTEGEPLQEGPLQEAIIIQLTTQLVVNLEDETICVTADPATVTVKEENELGVTYAANLIGYILTQDILP